MIELINVSKSYNYKKANVTAALKSIDLTIGKGEMTAIIGPSGAGKSTLLHVIGGLCNIQSGKYFFDGADVSAFTDVQRSKLRNEKIGIVMQNFALIDEYSVIDNVMIPLFFRHSVKNKRERAERAMEQTGIAHLKNKQAEQ